MKHQKSAKHALAFFVSILFVVASCSVHHSVAGDEIKAVEFDANGKASDVIVSADGDYRNRSGLFSDIFPQKINWATPSSTTLESTGAAISNLVKNILTTIGPAGGSGKAEEDEESTDDDKATSSLDVILSTARDMAATASASQSERSIFELMENFKVHFDESATMMKEAFAHVDFGRLSLAALWYYVEKTESTKTPSWKRTVHRFHKRVDVSTILELHDALYLMQIAYLPTKERILQEVDKFRNGTYEAVHAVTTGHPTEPAHFVMMPKLETKTTVEEKRKQSNGSDIWGGGSGDDNEKSPSAVEIIIALRGTGDPGDFVSDAMLNATQFRTGSAHDEIARSGKFLANLHVDAIRRIWEVSGGRDSVKVVLVGYSLGAGVAAIAAMELNDFDFIDARAIGFGCPALLDLQQSEGAKDYITSVVTDADIVSRMSGPLIANMLLDVMSHDWTTVALVDLERLIDHVGEILPLMMDKDTIMKWANDTLERKYKPYFSKINKERMTQELYPPGTCIHLWRDGVGWSATYTPCTFFDEVEFSRTLIEDHLLEPGYHPALLSLAREAKGDHNFDFPHDLMSLGKLA